MKGRVESVETVLKMWHISVAAEAYPCSVKPVYTNLCIPVPILTIVQNDMNSVPVLNILPVI